MEAAHERIVRRGRADEGSGEDNDSKQHSHGKKWTVRPAAGAATVRGLVSRMQSSGVGTASLARLCVHFANTFKADSSALSDRLRDPIAKWTNARRAGNVRRSAGGRRGPIRLPAYTYTSVHCPKLDSDFAKIDMFPSASPPPSLEREIRRVFLRSGVLLLPTPARGSFCPEDGPLKTTTKALM